MTDGDGSVELYPLPRVGTAVRHNTVSRVFSSGVWHRQSNLLLTNMAKVMGCHFHGLVSKVVTSVLLAYSLCFLGLHTSVRQAA